MNKKLRHLLVTINGVTSLLLYLILLIDFVIYSIGKGNNPIDLPSLVFYVVMILLCLLLPLGLLKPGMPISKVLATTGAVVTSLTGIWGLIIVIAQLSGRPLYVEDLPIPLMFIFSLFFLFNVVVSASTTPEWVEERRNALPPEELRRLENHKRIVEKVIEYLTYIILIIACFVAGILIIRENWGRSFSDIGRDAVYFIKMCLFCVAPMVFVNLLFAGIGGLLDRPNPKITAREENMNTVESHLERETIQDDMEALTMLIRLLDDTGKKEIHSRASILVISSHVQYRLGYFDVANESIRKALGLYEKIVDQERGETDATLYLKSVLYDVSSKISGTNKDYEKKLEDCRTMLKTLESHTMAYAYRNEIGRAFTEMADAQRGLGQYEEALISCKQAVAEFDQLSSQDSATAKNSYALLNRVKAEILLDTGRIEEAEECASKAIELYSGMNEGYESPVGAAHLVMSRIQSKRGDSEEAEKEHLIAESLVRDRYGKEHPIYKAVFDSRPDSRPQR